MKEANNNADYHRPWRRRSGNSTDVEHSVRIHSAVALILRTLTVVRVELRFNTLCLR